jgi:hypothetical protein
MQFENHGDHDKWHIKWFIKILGFWIQNPFNIIVNFGFYNWFNDFWNELYIYICKGYFNLFF